MVPQKTFPAFPAHAHTTILRIWQEAHGNKTDNVSKPGDHDNNSGNDHSGNDSTNNMQFKTPPQYTVKRISWVYFQLFTISDDRMMINRWTHLGIYRKLWQRAQ